MPDRLLDVLWHEAFELRLGVLMLEVGLACAPKHTGEFGPGIWHSYRRSAPPRCGRGGSTPKTRGRSPLSTQRQNFFSAVKRKVLIEQIGWYLDLDPLAAAGDNREHRGGGMTHMLCWSWAMCFSAAASSENDHGSMNLASNTAPVPSTMPSSVAAIQRSTGWRTQLDIDHLPGRALVPLPVQVFGREPELDDEIARQVLGSAPASHARGAARRPRRCP